MQQRPTIAITMGDPAGVGPELIVKALSLREMYRQAIPIVIGDHGTISDAIATVGSVQSVHKIQDCSGALGIQGVIDLVELGNGGSASFGFGQLPAGLGGAAVDYLKTGLDLACHGQVDAIVAGPTDVDFAKELGENDLVTVGVSGKFRMAYPTQSVPLRSAIARVTGESAEFLIGCALDACKRLGVSDPKVAVLGINPRPDRFPDSEETGAIMPAVSQARQSGAKVFGPVSPEEAFAGLYRGIYDIGVAMYHEQGRFPMELLKLMGHWWRAGWPLNAEARLIWGLPCLVTTVGHGAQRELAGRNKADPGSLVEAIRLAVDVARRNIRQIGQSIENHRDVAP